MADNDKINASLWMKSIYSFALYTMNLRQLAKNTKNVLIIKHLYKMVIKI